MRILWPKKKKKTKPPTKKRQTVTEQEEQAGLMKPEPENTDEKEMNNADLCNISTE